MSNCGKSSPPISTECLFPQELYPSGVPLLFHISSTSGNIPFRYLITTNDEQPQKMGELNFQRGNPKDGVNGGTLEGYMWALEHRLKACSDIGMGCPENDEAIHHLQMARKALDRRSADRTERNVRGTKEK
jgi:hypothetical protein